MSLIHTCELNGVNPFDYLIALQKHAEELAKHPAAWMPWNYRDTLAQFLPRTSDHSHADSCLARARHPPGLEDRIAGQRNRLRCCSAGAAGATAGSGAPAGRSTWC